MTAITSQLKFNLLLKSVKEQVEEHEKIGNISKFTKKFVKTEVEDFKNIKGVVYFQRAQREILKEVWDPADQLTFFNITIKQLPEYADLVLELTKDFNIEVAHAEHDLEIFFSHSGYNILQKILDKTDCDEDYASFFIGDLAGSPVTWRLKIWIQGLCTDNAYKVSENLTIKQTTSSDVENVFPWLMQANNPPAGTILEFTYASQERGNVDVDEAAESIVGCLRLFKQGSVFSAQTEAFPMTFFRELSQSGSSICPFVSVYKYRICEEDIPNLAILIAKTQPALPKMVFQQASELKNPIAIALERFNDALKEQRVIRRITSAIMCLEALYLKEKEFAELKHRLSQRTSTILLLAGLNPLKTSEDLKRGYTIRSKFVHGSIELQKYEDETLAGKILEYARISLLVFLQLNLSANGAKNNFLKKIDDGLLDSESHRNLKKEIEKSCFVYGLQDSNFDLPLIGS
jgi:Apea-like HEPN